jgi:hypothetical protein
MSKNQARLFLLAFVFFAIFKELTFAYPKFTLNNCEAVTCSEAATAASRGVTSEARNPRIVARQTEPGTGDTVG